MDNSVITFLKEVTKPFRVYLVVFAFISLICAVDLSLRPYIIKLLIDQVNKIVMGESSLATIVKPISWYMSVSIIMIGISTFYEMLWVNFFANFKSKIGTILMKYLLHKPYNFYQEQFVGALVSKLLNCTEIMPRIIRTINEDFIKYLFALIVSTYMVWQVSAYVGVALVIWVILYVSACIALAPTVRKLTINITNTASQGAGHISDILANIMSVKLFCREAEEHAFVKTNFKSWAKFFKARNRILLRIYIIQLSTFILLQGFCLYWLCIGLKTGVVTSGDFALVFMINISINNCLFGLSRTIADFSENISMVTHGLQVINPTNVSGQALNNIINRSLEVNEGEIKFDHVYFGYKNSALLFEDLCVTINSGQKVGLVGYSGGGKSTFISLILRLYEVDRGCILIDNQAIKDVSLSSLRSKIAVIPQDALQFYRTLKENISYGQPEASYADIVRAAQQAHAHEFISKLSKGYDSMVGEKGIRLSGGQRQRVSIARGFLKNAPIMILDEATSQLDSITESYIQEALWDNIKGKTTIVIAHRLSTLLHMDRILVFDKGKIVEDGSHTELLVKNGLYRALWDAQVGGFLPTKEDL